MAVGLQAEIDAEIAVPARVNAARPLVSVIMSMRNCAVTVAAAVHSVQLQTLQNWELVVVDDGSSDQSAATVAAFGDPRIRLIREATSSGLATRLNQAVAQSRGDFIARMDADDICFPDRLTRQVEGLQKNPRIDVLGCRAVVFRDDTGLVGALPIGLTHEAITARPFRGFPLPHPTWCGRADWFRSNRYDSTLMKTQDQDLLLRTYEISHFAALADVLVGYRQDKLDLKKMLFGRWVFIGSIWRHANSSNQSFAALKGIAAQLFKGAVDIVLIGLGLNRFAQGSRLDPVPPSVAEQWLALQRQLCKNKVID